MPDSLSTIHRRRRRRPPSTPPLKAVALCLCWRTRLAFVDSVRAIIFAFRVLQAACLSSRPLESPTILGSVWCARHCSAGTTLQACPRLGRKGLRQSTEYGVPPSTTALGTEYGSPKSCQTNQVPRRRHSASAVPPPHHTPKALLEPRQISPKPARLARPPERGVHIILRTPGARTNLNRSWDPP